MSARNYPYNLSTRTLLTTGAVNIGLTICFIYAALQLKSVSPADALISWCAPAAGVMFTILLIALFLRTNANNNELRLDDSAITLPHGLLQNKTATIPYSQITKVWESFYGPARTINIGTKDGALWINAALLPDPDSYDFIREYLSAKVYQAKARASTISLHDTLIARRRAVS